MATLTTDLNITARDISGLTSADAVAGFLTQLGYNTDRRSALTPESIGLAGDSAAAMKSIEVLSEDAEGFLRVVFVQLRSLTAKSRNDLARVLGRTNVDHLLILTSDFSVLEFVLLHKRRRESRGPVGITRVEVVPLAFAVVRKAPATKELRTIRRFTWTSRDGLEQYDKLRSVFEAAAFTEEYFCNRALFADHYLLSRLREDPAWRDNPTQAFAKVKDQLSDARGRWLEKGEQLVRDELYEPLFELLGFKSKVNKAAGEDHIKPDYLLTAKSGKGTAAAFVYAWDRWLDGPDFNLDHETSEENPGACVVSALEQGVADWIIVTNGKVWRLYSRQAHSRATNFYEVDLIEALVASGDTDPNEAFRYWWLFFRAEGFAPRGDGQPGCWLDAVAEGSRDYAKRLGERLKERIFVTIFPHLAQGFLEDRKKRLGIRRQPTEEELSDTYEATLTLLYRLLFLLYAEARDLLPIREAPYREASLKKVKEEIADKAGVAESEVTARLTHAYAAGEYDLYDRLIRLCEAMDRGASTLNVPIYNGGLFITKPVESDNREQRIARFLHEHKVPDRHLALAIDRLARDPDEKTLGLVSIDYKSLEVRHLGSIYEGLLEFKLKVAQEDLATATEKNKETYIPLGKAKTKRGKPARAVVRKGEVYLSNHKAERKASGSYYTPDPIVKYIVEHTVGPVLIEKLESLRDDLRQVRKTFDREIAKAKAYPVKKPSGDTWEPRDFAAEKTYIAHKNVVEQLFEFRTLDPAMGSGHFLVEAVDFITDRMLAFLNQFPVNPVTFMLDRTRCNILEALGEQGISVDPDKLTEVNLLKRHVLKRCIYGVDLNPMAVELAKVSLWLDAFTIGAPLSFLDHHLRCGNSLIGASFKDLEELTKATAKRSAAMFGIDYEPLLRAIQHVLHVNAMSDATAAEVKQSASEYGQARDELSGYQIVLDLLVAKYFGLSKAVGLLEHGHDLDLSNRAAFLKSLTDEREQAIVTQAGLLAQQRFWRFFHWEIEFPEVFFGFADDNRRHLKHKDHIVSGTAGFDVVIGNPPYDELSEHALGRELPEKEYFGAIEKYKDAFGGRLNLFRLFVVRSLLLLAAKGRHSFIVPMSLLGDQFTASLRRRLLTEGWLRQIEAFPQKDDPHNRVFFDAKLSTCVYVAEKWRDTEHPIRIRTFPGKSLLDVFKQCLITLQDIQSLEPHGLSLPAIGDQELVRWKGLTSYPRVAQWKDAAHCYLGELMTNASNAHLTSDKPVGPQLLRGANINYYVLLDEPKQGEPLYLKERQYLKEYAEDIRSQHHLSPRIGFQESSPIDNWRRLIGCRIPEGHYCVHKIRYFTPDAKYHLDTLLAIFNSRVTEWRFGLTSTNNSVNAYEIDALPLPCFERLKAENPPAIEVKQWRRLLAGDESAVVVWEGSVIEIMKTVDATARAWPNAIHDALAAAGNELAVLAEWRQKATNDFGDWLVSQLGVDEDRFSGMTYLRGGQADFDCRSWDWFSELLIRNRNACKRDLDQHIGSIKRHYQGAVQQLTEHRRKFELLGAAVDRVVWQLVGMNPDGDLPSQ